MKEKPREKASQKWLHDKWHCETHILFSFKNFLTLETFVKNVTNSCLWGNLVSHRSFLLYNLVSSVYCNLKGCLRFRWLLLFVCKINKEEEEMTDTSLIITDSREGSWGTSWETVVRSTSLGFFNSHVTDVVEHNLFVLSLEEQVFVLQLIIQELAKSQTKSPWVRRRQVWSTVFDAKLKNSFWYQHERRGQSSFQEALQTQHIVYRTTQMHEIWFLPRIVYCLLLSCETSCRFCSSKKKVNKEIKCVKYTRLPSSRIQSLNSQPTSKTRKDKWLGEKHRSFKSKTRSQIKKK